MQSPVKAERKHLACKCSVFQENDFPLQVLTLAALLRELNKQLYMQHCLYN